MMNDRITHTVLQVFLGREQDLKCGGVCGVSVKLFVVNVI